MASHFLKCANHLGFEILRPGSLTVADYEVGTFLGVRGGVVVAEASKPKYSS